MPDGSLPIRPRRRDWLIWLTGHRTPLSGFPGRAPARASGSWPLV